MNEEYIQALADAIKTFLNFSDEWLENETIDQETYIEITRNKKEFISGIQLKQG